MPLPTIISSSRLSVAPLVSIHGDFAAEFIVKSFGIVFLFSLGFLQTKFDCHMKCWCLMSAAWAVSPSSVSHLACSYFSVQNPIPLANCTPEPNNGVGSLWTPFDKVFKALTSINGLQWQHATKTDVVAATIAITITHECQQSLNPAKTQSQIHLQIQIQSRKQ